MHVHGNLFDIHTGEIRSAEVTIEGGRIVSIHRNSHRGSGFLLPPFVDAHLHLSSTFLPPQEVARLVLRHGTLGIQFDQEDVEESVGKDYFLSAIRSSPVTLQLGERQPLYHTLTEARDAAAKGEMILIAEENLVTLFPLLSDETVHSVFASGHAPANQLFLGHINRLVKRAVEMGLPLLRALQIASLCPIEQYELPMGLLRVGDPADLIIVSDLNSFRVLEAYSRGQLLFKEEVLIPKKTSPHLSIPRMEVVKVEEVELWKGAIALSRGGKLFCFGRSGSDLERATSLALKMGGGLVVCDGGQIDSLPLPIGGVLSDEEGEFLARKLADVSEVIRSFGAELSSLLVTN